jgi:hypothetical protein
MLLNGRDDATVDVQPHLVVRQSCGPARTR